MKRLFLVIAVLTGLTASSAGQSYKTSLGFRIGVPFEYGLTVKHFLSKKNAVEGILKSNWGGIVITGLYENEHWTGVYPGLNWFWGVGAHAGFWDPGQNPHIAVTYVGSVLGLDGIAGLEYTFDEMPLNLSLDMIPSINLTGDKRWGGINSAVSVRYVF